MTRPPRRRQAPPDQAVASDGERVKLADHRPRTEGQRDAIVTKARYLISQRGGERAAPSGERLATPVDGYDYIEWDRSQVRLCMLGTDNIVAMSWTKIRAEIDSAQEGLF